MSASTRTRSSGASGSQSLPLDSSGAYRATSTSPLRSSGDDNCGSASESRIVNVDSRHKARVPSKPNHARKSGAALTSKSGTKTTVKTAVSPRCSLVVALFYDGFVCRHLNRQHECIEGFAQPYDAESSYFLACIDNGRVPDGLNEMIACTCSDGSVLTEVQDYRKVETAMCPVSSAFLPAASALSLVNNVGQDLVNRCHAWQILLQPSKSSGSPRPETALPVVQAPPAREIFDHFPDVEPGELETLALDAKRQLLEDEILPSSPSSQSSPCLDDSQSFGFFPNDPPERGERESMNAGSSSKTPIVSAPATASLSPSERKSSRSSSSANNSSESGPTRRRKRQFSKKARTPHGARARASKRIKHASVDLKPERSVNPASSSYDDESKHGYRRSEVKREASVSPSVSVTPLPATQLFLSKLKGRRRRPMGEELNYGKPAWVTIAHVGRLFRAATHFEQEHARFLHVNVQRLMQAEKPAPEVTEEVSGSMRNLAHQLDDMARPTDVIAAATSRKIRAKQKARRNGSSSDISSVSESTSSSEAVWQSAAVSTAMINPAVDPVLRHHRVEDEGGAGFEVSYMYAPQSYAEKESILADVPPFNTFDADGSLEEIQNV